MSKDEVAMEDEQVKPFQEWSAGELRTKLDAILKISGNRLTTLVPVLEETKRAAESDLS